MNYGRLRKGDVVHFPTESHLVLKATTVSSIVTIDLLNLDTGKIRVVQMHEATPILSDTRVEKAPHPWPWRPKEDE